ncbi:MAG: DUF4838 domain-containing protein [Oscillospiraceae bacterium]|nr:DUF4838 domain-containing protein [Oscillospiraceae bacterium]
MFTINKLRADHVLDFAAEELKEYLRMLMPRCGEIEIAYNPEAQDGFRLGLLEDFGIESEATDPVLDDVVHIDTDEKGGILAGSNPRSVLFAVYRFLRLNGCRWLYPGVDGEHVPVRDITPQKYHHMADHRFRGHCNEGAESQTCMLETIDFYAKQECNVYMLEFDNPFIYYDYYYAHQHNEANRPPEPVPQELVLQWKRQCEAEIAKRGLQFHDMGHGWTAEPFGLNSALGWKKDAVQLTEKQQQAIALEKGVRKLHGDVALNTNLCMSTPWVRTQMARYITNYAKQASNVTYLHVWLADGSRNHCECEECQKLNPSDYYLMIMNELDEMLTAEGLDTRIVFICYVDTLFAPLQEKIKNSTRFSLLYAPIHRSYCSSVVEGDPIPDPEPYVRNAWLTPKTAMDHLALLRKWQESWKGPTFSYEYHFWRHQCDDLTGLYIARRVYEDILSLKYMGLDGYVEDGSQRSFWPNGLAIYVYAETLLNKSVKFEDLVEDYYKHAYGQDWQEALKFYQDILELDLFPYLAGGRRLPDTPHAYLNEAMLEVFDKLKAIIARAEPLGQAHRVCPTRPQRISWRLLELQKEYIQGVIDVMTLRCQNKNEEAWLESREFAKRFGVHEFEIERYFDHSLYFRRVFLRLPTNQPSLQEGN